MITVNQQESRVWRPGMTVEALLRDLKYTFPRVVVTIDGELVPPDALESTLVPDGAEVRVIHLMAGG
jgi:thiamine biosynthesis protein ThiS